MVERRVVGRVRRSRQVATVLARHGLGFLVRKHGLEAHTRAEGASAGPTQLRLALEELGVTFIKLGQILSTRADLLPPAYQAELAKLQDCAPPIPEAAVRAALADALHQPVERIFARFDPTPLAAASIGQVHAATLLDGTEVVVKVRRPGAAEQVEADLAVLTSLATTAAQHWDLAQEYDVVGLAQEFADTLRAELDYAREAHNAERFAQQFAGNNAIHIPRVYWETTTPVVLTLERLHGCKIGDLAALDAAGVDRRALAERAAQLTLEMIFQHGFFHADPHPGNFFVEPDGRIGLVDFGMVGTVDESTQERLAGVLAAVAGQDAARLADALIELCVARGRVDRRRLERDLARLLGRYYDCPLREIAVGSLLEEALAVVRHHRLSLPPTLALLLKTLIMEEGLGVQLDPSFQLASVLHPYAERLLVRQYAPMRLTRRLAQTSLDVAQLGIELPMRSRRILDDLDRGTIEIGVRPEHFDPLVRRLERLAHRLVLGILAAAFINGLAILLAAYHLPAWERWIEPLAAVGLALATALGGYLAFVILRAGHG